MPDILFIIQDTNLPSSRVRVLNLIPELEKNGLRPQVRVYPKTTKERLRLIREAGKHDLVVLQKILLSPLFFFLLKLYSKRLVFDFDDAIYYRHDSRKNMHNHTRMSRFVRTVRGADILIAGNRNLGDFVRQYNSNVSIVPSAVETRNVPLKVHDPANKKTVIGWVGGPINLIHLEMIVPVLRELSASYPLELRILCSESLDIKGVDTVFIPWKLGEQEREIAQFDIGVMPLPDNAHTRCKCGYKALQYMAAGVPAVVSDVGINAAIVENGKDGLVAASVGDFLPCLKNLIVDPSLRKRLGEAAHLKAHRDYSIHVVAPKLADILLNALPK